MSKYRNIFILDDATWVVRTSAKAIPATELCSTRPKRARFITRYYPSSKRWRVYSVKTFQPGPRVGLRQTYMGGAYFHAPTEAAAIMAAIMHISL